MAKFAIATNFIFFEIQVLMNKIVIYFSHQGENYNIGFLKEGNAEHIAKVIKNITGADIFEIIPSKDYSEDYMKCISEAKEEFQLDARPKQKIIPLIYLNMM